MLTHGAQLTTRITSMMQKQRLDEMFPRRRMTQKGRIQFGQVIERDSSFDCERDRAGKGGEEYIPGTSRSLCGCVNAFCCCLCSARVDQCLLPPCLRRPVMRSYRLCLKCPHIRSYTNTAMPTHTHINSTNTEKLVHGHAEGRPHIVFTHLFLLLPLTRALLHHCFCFKV